MRKVLYLSLKEFRTAQKRQLDGDGTTNSNGEFTAHVFDGVDSASFFCFLSFYFPG